MSLSLVIDQSTSATKALLFDRGGAVVGRESRDHTQFYPRPGWVEHDADEIWSNTVAAVKALLDRNSERSKEVGSLSITNQRETIVVFDRATGAPLCPALVWQDRRGDTLCAEQREAGAETLIHRRTGLKIDGYFSASKIAWLLDNVPGLRSRVMAGSALIGTIDAYLVFRLTGGQVYATDSTNASRTLLFDISRRVWDEELCALWRIPRNVLPEARDPTSRFGETTINGILPQPLPICGVMGDSQASMFAQQCFAPGATKVTFGTGSSLMLNVGSQPRFSDKGILTALAWTHEGKPTYAFEGIIISAASTLTWLRDQMGLAADVPQMEAMAISVESSSGVSLVPAFSGLGFPHWRPDARAAILGLSSHSDRRHIARAAFESIAYQVRDTLDGMRAESGFSPICVKADGGPTVSAFLMQLCADLLGVELRTSVMPDCSALGALRAGQIGLGTVESIEALNSFSFPERVYSPSPGASETLESYFCWREALERVLRVT